MPTDLWAPLVIALIPVLLVIWTERKPPPPKRGTAYERVMRGRRTP